MAKNYYPEFPFVPYKKTPVEMQEIIKYIQNTKVGVEVKRSAYIIIRNESANGKIFFNYNGAGFQADSGRWAAIHDSKIIGVVRKLENGTGKERLFLAFHDVGGCLDMLSERVQGRGLYVGGDTKKIWVQHIDNVQKLARAYYKEWVTGNVKAEPSPEATTNFIYMYKQASNLFT